jgi:hypothetical protein
MVETPLASALAALDTGAGGSAELEALLRQMLAPDAASRPTSAVALARGFFAAGAGGRAAAEAACGAADACGTRATGAPAVESAGEPGAAADAMPLATPTRASSRPLPEEPAASFSPALKPADGQRRPSLLRPAGSRRLSLSPVGRALASRERASPGGSLSPVKRPFSTPAEDAAELAEVHARINGGRERGADGASPPPRPAEPEGQGLAPKPARRASAPRAVNALPRAGGGGSSGAGPAPLRVPFLLGHSNVLPSLPADAGAADLPLGASILSRCSTCAGGAPAGAPGCSCSGAPSAASSRAGASRGCSADMRGSASSAESLLLRPADWSGWGSAATSACSTATVTPRTSAPASGSRGSSPPPQMHWLGGAALGGEWAPLAHAGRQVVFHETAPRACVGGFRPTLPPTPASPEQGVCQVPADKRPPASLVPDAPAARPFPFFTVFR